MNRKCITRERPCFQIVGVDEADISKGKISFTSPIAKVLSKQNKSSRHGAVKFTGRFLSKMEAFTLPYGSILMDASAYPVVVSYLKIVKENVFTAGILGSTNGQLLSGFFSKGRIHP